jgi:hypothetical protein
MTTRRLVEAKKALARANSTTGEAEGSGRQTDKDRTYYENKCAALDRQIDKLVYELYGLTEAEIAIVEGAKP